MSGMRHVQYQRALHKVCNTRMPNNYSTSSTMDYSYLAQRAFSHQILSNKTRAATFQKTTGSRNLHITIA
jgi:hypothetical protein